MCIFKKRKDAVSVTQGPGSLTHVAPRIKHVASWVLIYENHQMGKVPGAFHGDLHSSGLEALYIILRFKAGLRSE